MEIYSHRLAELMDQVLSLGETAHNLMVSLSAEAGFYRKRVCDLTVGDEIGVGANAWQLVTLVESTATAEGFGVYRVVGETDEFLFDPADIVDVKAAPTPELF
jgi:hypothetical protein